MTDPTTPARFTIPTIVPNGEVLAAIRAAFGSRQVPEDLPCLISLTAEETGAEPVLREYAWLGGCGTADIPVWSFGAPKKMRIFRHLARDGERLVWLYTTTEGEDVRLGREVAASCTSSVVR